MHLPVPFVRPQITDHPSAMVRVVSHEEIAWHSPARHVFKAPPLNVRPPLADVAALAAERRRELSLVS